MTRPTKLNFVTCEFGRPGSWMAGKHTGIDYRAPIGTPVYATKRGVVNYAGSGGTYGPAYGNYVVVESKHEGRTIRHLYAHFSQVKVSTGKRVKTGQLLGYSGDTGNTNGPHLHYEERTFPYNYWAFKPPVLPQWQPESKKTLLTILKRIGLRK